MTGDEKPNWWRTARLGTQDRAIGPHFELIRDIESASKNRFMMYTQEGFLSEAPKYLGVPEQTQAIEEVRQIREGASTEKDIGLIQEPKTSHFEELKSLEKAESGQESGSMGKDADLIDEPKTSPLEESKSQEKPEPKEEVN